MKRGFPVALLVVLEKWFEMSVTCVRWHRHDPEFFRLIYIYTSLFAQKEQHKKQTIKKQQQTTKQTGTNTALTMISSHDMLGLLTGHNRRKCSQRDFSGHRHCGSDSHIV